MSTGTELKADQAVSGSLYRWLLSDEEEELILLPSNSQTKLVDEYMYILERSYEDHLWYLVSLKPLNEPYEKQLSWFKEKALKWVKDKMRTFSPSVMFLARHILSSKDHYHLLVCVPSKCRAVPLGTQPSVNPDSRRLSCEDFKIWNHKYKIDVRPVPTQGDRIQVFKYIYKEGVHRNLMAGLDYCTLFK